MLDLPPELLLQIAKCKYPLIWRNDAEVNQDLY
jgi:hypothetical protein